VWLRERGKLALETSDRGSESRTLAASKPALVLGLVRWREVGSGRESHDLCQWQSSRRLDPREFSIARGEPSLTRRLRLTCIAICVVRQTIAKTLFRDRRQQERTWQCAAFKPARPECGQANERGDLLS
jgi:hypothetical protein